MHANQIIDWKRQLLYRACNVFVGADPHKPVLGARCKPSIDGRGAWRDSAFLERLWRTVKYEHVYQRVYASVSQAKSQIAQYRDWYHLDGAHSSLDDQAPDQAYWDKPPKLACKLAMAA